jgi:hypothetical protein
MQLAASPRISEPSRPPILEEIAAENPDLRICEHGSTRGCCLVTGQMAQEGVLMTWSILSLKASIRRAPGSWHQPLSYWRANI